MTIQLEGRSNIDQDSDDLSRPQLRYKTPGNPDGSGSALPIFISRLGVPVCRSSRLQLAVAHQRTRSRAADCSVRPGGWPATRLPSL